MIHISQEVPAEAGAREALLDRAMGPARFLKPSERLRRGRMPADGLALVARFGAHIVGSVRLWPVVTGDGRPALLLGPLAVDPDWQGHGIGSALMETAVTGAAALGHGAIVLVGDAPYYGRFGFTAEHTRLLKMPAPVLRNRFLGLELRPGALIGAAGKLVATGQPVLAPLPNAAALPLVA
jgi:predicted N-acetyltransferase YhbS